MSDFSTPTGDVELMRQMRRCSHLLYHKFSLNFLQNRILLVLRREGSMTQKALMSILQIQPGSLSEVIAKVESAGLVERRRCEDDRRNFEVRLTEEGEQQAQAFERDREDMAKLLFETLDDSEKQTLSGILTKLHAHWDVCTFERRLPHDPDR